MLWGVILRRPGAGEAVQDFKGPSEGRIQIKLQLNVKSNYEKNLRPHNRRGSTCTGRMLRILGKSISDSTSAPPTSPAKSPNQGDSMVGPQLSPLGHQIPWPLPALLPSYLSSFVHPFNLCIVANPETQSNYRIIGTILYKFTKR